MTKLLPTALVLALATLCTGHAQARSFSACDVESDYDMRLAPDVLTFSRSTGTPQRVEMRNGALAIDGATQALSEADVIRIAKFERDVRAMVPEVKAIAIDAVGLGTEAIVHVASTFAGDGANPQSLDRLRSLGRDLQSRIEASDSTAEWRTGQFDAAMAGMTAELAPMIVGDIAAVALSAALTGDEEKLAELEGRAAKLEQAVEQHIDARADGIEARAKTLCPRIAALDAIESELDLRLADGSRLDLLQVGAQ